jgi:hypothetical protein
MQVLQRADTIGLVGAHRAALVPGRVQYEVLHDELSPAIEQIQQAVWRPPVRPATPCARPPTRRNRQLADSMQPPGMGGLRYATVKRLDGQGRRN